MSIPRVGRLTLLALGFCGVSLADVPDLGPKLRNFDPSKDCKCVQSSIEHNQKILDGYRKLAESYRNFLKDLGDGTSSPTWVDPAKLNKSQVARLVALKKKFGEEESKMAKDAPERDCGFPPDAEIVLVTSSLTGEPPSKEDQQKYKPLFPCEEIYDAVMLHEYYHGGEWSMNNPNKPAGSLPHTRTPYGQALEEAKGYEIEIDELQKLAAKCPRSEASGGDKGQRFAQRERVRRAANRVAAYAAIM